MHKNLMWRAILILFVVGGFGSIAYFQGLDFGLDLRGGAEILYKVHTDQAEVGTVNIMGTTLEVLGRRIDRIGVAEYKLERSGDNHILLQLPDKGEQEIINIKKMLIETGKLTFHLVASPERTKEHRERGTTPSGYVWKDVRREGEDDDTKTGRELLIHEKADFQGDSIGGVQIVPWEGGIEWAVKIELDRGSRNRFARLTRDHVGERLAIVLDGTRDGRLYSAPEIKEEITGGIPYITGGFTHEEAEGLATVLLSGRLPAPITVEYENVVGPSLGQDSIRDGTKAIAIGMALVLAFMAIYYLVAGLVANIAVLLNLVILFGVLSYLDATLTLPGLAGIVLLIGMAVDANVLIFERIREELAQGKALSLAIRNGYKRVRVTILDANLTTLFTAVILFWAGTGPVRGFAVTLGIGLLASMFTALFVTRTVFDFLIACGFTGFFKMFSIIGKTTFKFSSYWKATSAISTVVILLGLSLYFQRGREMYDIDFLGGGLIHVKFAEARDIDTVRQDIKGLGGSFKSCQVQSVWSTHENISDFNLSREFEIRMMLPEKDEEHETFLDNAKAQMRDKFASTLVQDPIEFSFGTIQKAQKSPFTGGVIVTMVLNERMGVGVLEARLRKVIGDAKVRGYGEDAGEEDCSEVALITAMADGEQVKALIENELASVPFPRTRKISAGMAVVMMSKAIKAMVLAMIGIIIYMAFRFQLRFGVGAVVALVHDVLFTMGALAVARVEVNLPIIAAFLTIVGYSLNDTIVVFDRIRENMASPKGKTFVEIVNLSINQTLGRTILTSLTTLFAAGALFIWGGGVIHNFAYALIVGVLAGTYSSIFVASPIIVLWEGKVSE